MKWLFVLLALAAGSYGFVVRACNLSERKAIANAYQSKVDTVIYLGCFEHDSRLYWEDTTFYIIPIWVNPRAEGDEIPYNTAFAMSIREDGFSGFSSANEILMVNKYRTELISYVRGSSWAKIYGLDASYTYMEDSDTLYHVKKPINGRKYGFRATKGGLRVNGYDTDDGFVLDGENCIRYRNKAPCERTDSVDVLICSKWKDGKAIEKSRTWQSGELVAIAPMDSDGEYHGWANQKTCGNNWRYVCYSHGREYEPGACEGMKKPK